jgi:hypothetical protein
MSLKFVFQACKAFGLTRADRLEVATFVLDRNVESFNQLGPVEIERLTDAMRGAVTVAKIRMERQRGERI